MHAFPNELDTVRLGLSVSKKVGNAVERNKVRRRLREIFSANLQEITGNSDLVISARPGAAQASFEELREEFLRGVRKLGRVELKS